MARPIRNNVDYFPHYSPGKGMFFVETKHGNDGYAVWFKMLEELAKTDYHALDLRDDGNVMYLAAKCRVAESKLFEIINDIARAKGIDPELWACQIVWSEKFSESIADAYARRSNSIATKSDIISHFRVNANINQVNVDINPVNSSKKPQSKVEYSKVEESILNDNATPPKNEDDWLLKIPDEAYRKEAKKLYIYYRSAIKDEIFIDTLKTKINTTPEWVMQQAKDHLKDMIATKKQHQTERQYREHLRNWCNRMKEVQAPPKPKRPNNGD